MNVELITYMKKKGLSYNKRKDKGNINNKEDGITREDGTTRHKKRRNNSVSIRFELIGSFLIPVILIIALGYASYSKASEGMIANFENASMVTLDMMKEYYELGFKSVSSKAIQINNDETLQDYYTGDHKNNPIQEENELKKGKKIIMTSATSEHFIDDMYVIASYGKSISSNSNFKTAIYNEFIASKEGKEIIDSKEDVIWIGQHESIDASVSKTLKDYFITSIRKFSISEKGVVGYIVTDISNEAIMNLLDKTDFGTGSISGVITQDGKELLKGEYDKGYSFLNQNFYKEALENSELSGLEYVDLNKESYLFIFNKMEIGNTMICSLIPTTQVLKQADSVKSITVFMVVLGVIAALGIGTFMASGISSTINKTNEKLEMVAGGDLTVKLKIKRKDEFKIFGESINNMFASMKSLIQKMISVSSTTTHSANEVTQASETLLHTSKNISMAVADIEEGVHQQANDAENCLLQMSGLAGQINTVYENTNEIRETAKNTRNSVNDGIVIMDTLSENAKDTSDITQLVINNIQELNTESNAIAGIIGTINDIAEQTNLLSLNASIEAARAGEAGRGFAVVADEIRKLAVQSAEAASKIGIIIEHIGSKTNKTVEAAKQAGAIVAKQESTLVETVTVFKLINEQVEKLTGNLSKISMGIEKIEQAKNDTLGAVESISSTSEETAAASTQLGVTAESQLKAVEILNAAAAQLGQDAKNLEETANIFKI